MRKQIWIVGLLLSGAALPAFADQPMAGMEMQENAVQASHHGTGKVVSVNREKPGIKLAHEAIASLGWPAMTMNFSVEKASLLDGLKAGDTVQFELRQLKPGKWEIVRIERK